MRTARAIHLSLIAYVVPAIALALGAFLADEPVGWSTLGGAALILSGVGAVLWAGQPRHARTLSGRGLDTGGGS